jgi:hypothetical protein
MSRTLIQQARAAGNVVALWDFQVGNFRDQSGNGIVLTVPADASLSKQGLRCKSTPASFSLDMSAIKNFGVFALIRSFHSKSSNQVVAELTADYTAVNDGWQLRHDSSSDEWIGSFRTGGLVTSGGTSENLRTDRAFISVHFDRRFSYQAVNPYQFGVYQQDSRVDNNLNDGSGFANSTVYLCGGADFRLLSFGIVDFGDDSGNQWTATDQGRIYKQVRDRLVA